jgi:hypothetical protein
MAHFWTSENPDFEYVSQTQQADKDCYIVVKCISSTSKDVKFPTLQYSTNEVDYFDCTDLFSGEGEDIANGVTASPAGTNHTFAWDANADLGATFDGSVKLQFGVTNEDDTGDETQHISDWFALDFAPPTVSIGWPDGETISDTTPTLQRNASDTNPPIQTEWYVDDDPTFNDGNGRRQYQAYDPADTFTPAALLVSETWYFKCRCKDDTVSANESGWVSGSFTLSLAIKPYQIRVGGTTVIPIIVTDTAVEVVNRLREYESDATFDEGGANIVETRYREALRIIMECVDGTPFATLAQLYVWKNAKIEVFIEDIGGTSIGIGGLNISHTPATWNIINIHIINKPQKSGIIWYSIELEEAT